MKSKMIDPAACRMSIGGRYVTFFCALFFVSLFAACARESPSERAAEVGGVTAAQVINNPNAYVGKTVTVSGDVEEIHNPRAFNMDSGASVGELLVLGREPFPQLPDGGNRAFVVNDTATVTGTVRMLVTAEVEREIGWDLQPELEAEFNAKPVLIVQSASFKPNPNRAANTNNINSSNANAANMSDANMNAADANQPLTDMLVIFNTPDSRSLVGRRVQLDNVRVQKLVSERGFWIGDGDRRLFARLDERLNQGSAEWDVVIREGQTRTLTGEIREMPSADQIKNWGLVDAAEMKTLQDIKHYIHVNRLQETRRPTGQ